MVGIWSLLVGGTDRHGSRTVNAGIEVPAQRMMLKDPPLASSGDREEVDALDKAGISRDPADPVASTGEADCA